MFGNVFRLAGIVAQAFPPVWFNQIGNQNHTGRNAQWHLVWLFNLGKQLMPKAITDIAIEVSSFRIGSY